jgi:hypothetical protein
MGARPYLWGLVLVACGGQRLPCERLGELCTGETWYRGVAAVVGDAVAVDVDGDGVEEIVALTPESHQLALGYGEGTRSVVWLAERPVALAGLGSEVAVALAEGPGVAIFGVDADGRLERRRDLAVKYDASDLWSGELDGDAGAELVVVHPKGRLTVLEAESGAGREISIGGTLTAVAVADLDADGIVDVVVADPGRSAVHVLRGAGGGEFHPARKFLAIESIDGLVVADGDGDGDVDVLMRNMGRPGVIVLHNNGKGELSLPLELEFTGPEPSGRGLAVGPIGAGGVAGISVPQYDRLATWLREGTAWIGRVEDYASGSAGWIGGTAAGLLVGGDGVVAPFVYRDSATPIELARDSSVDIGHGDSAIAVGDLDGDGLLDVVTAGGVGMNVFLGTATGLTKTAAVQLEVVASQVEVVELTGDGRADILFSDGESVGVVQAGADGFTPRPVHVPAVPPRTLVMLRTGPNAPAIVAAVPRNFNPDEAVTGVAMLRFGGDGRVAEETMIADSLAVGGLVGVDVDGDGVDEPVLYAKRGDTPVLTRMTPSGAGFEPGPELDLSEFFIRGPDVVDMAVGDPDLDGAPELWISGARRIRISDLAAEKPSVVSLDGAFYADRFRDVDGDGHVDAVSVNITGNFFYWRGHGDGTFDEESLRYSFPGEPLLAMTREPGAQFDVATSSGDELAIHRLRNVVRPSNADEAFNFHGRATELAVVDLDGDGFDDVVTSSSDWHGGVQVLWGDETGALSRADGFGDTLESRGLTLGDLDGDGTAEVLVGDGVSWIQAYRFTPRAERVRMVLWGLNTLEQIQSVAVADVDDDGHADVLALAYARFQGEIGMRLTVAFGEGEGGNDILSFEDWRQVTFIDGFEEARLEVGDVDGDGMVDLLVRSPFPDVGRHGLLFAEGTRAWSEPVQVRGTAALFVPRGDDGRVDLLVQDGDTIVRHPDGELERRETLLEHQELGEGVLRRVADVDGDGRGDLLVRAPMGTDLWLHEDDGYRMATHVEHMQTVEVGDVDGDGRPDLVGLVGGTVAVRLAAKRE